MIGATFCSGIGTPELACPEIDWILASETEAFPRAVLQHRFGVQDARRSGFKGHALWADLTALRARHFRRLGIPFPEIVVAGTPCQAFSIAGLRKAMKDARGNLTMEFLRLVHALRRAGSLRTLLWENVPGILSHPENPFGCFLGGLVGSDDALPPPGNGSWPSAGMVSGPWGRAAWRILDAQYFGVAQRRKRVFVVADFGGGADPAAVLFERKGVRWHSSSRDQSGKDLACTLAGDARGGSRYRLDADTTENLIAFGGGNCSGQLDVAASLAAHGVRQDFEVETFVVAGPSDNRSGRPSLRANGGDCGDGSKALVIAPHLAGALTHGVDSQGKGGYAGRRREDDQNLVALRGVVHALRADGFDASEDGTGRGTPIVAFSLRGREGGSTPEVESGGDSPAVRTQQGGSSHTFVAFAQNQREEVRELDAAGRLPAVRRGDAKNETLLAFHARQDPDSGEVTHPLDTDGYSIGVTDASWRVRRLTPTECERLQGWPDHFTLIPWRGSRKDHAETVAWLRAAGVSKEQAEALADVPDGPRYRAIGNGMALPVIRWILLRILELNMRRAA